MNENETNNKEQVQPEPGHEVNTEKLKECESQNEEWKERYLRNAADFENFKKRTEKEKLLWMSAAQSSLLQELITIVDNFDRAFTQPTTDQSESIAGFALIYKELQKMLEKYGVIEIKELKEFNPAFHEAIMQVESADHKAGDIVQVLQKGYLFKSEVLRPAKVSVAK